MNYIEKTICVEAGLEAKFSIYLQSYSNDLYIKERPMVLILPGGGYSHTSEREAEPFAFAWLAAGYHAAVIHYSVTTRSENVKYPSHLYQIGAAMAMIREHADEWHVISDKIVVQGFSAGGHLAASYGIMWNRGFIADKLGVSNEILKPNALLLCYPVITSGPYAHRGSFEHLLKDDYDRLVDEMSLENQDLSDMPPAFLWTTDGDQAVPAENSLMMALAMRKQNIPLELHMFRRGNHGLGLANELTLSNYQSENEPTVAPWFDLAVTWIRTLWSEKE